MRNKFNEVTCLTCGWVHIELPLEFVIEQVVEFNAYFDSLPADVQEKDYGGRRSDILDYTKCKHCGGSYRNFRDFEEGDCPAGVTIGPILYRNHL